MPVDFGEAHFQPVSTLHSTRLRATVLTPVTDVFSVRVESPSRFLTKEFDVIRALDNVQSDLAQRVGTPASRAPSCWHQTSPEE